MTSRALLGFALLLSAGLSSPALAQDAASLKTEMIGQWELATADRSKTCVVTLQGDQVADGLKLQLETGCAAALPFTREVAAWSIKGLDIVRLQDARGKAVIDLTEVATGIFEGARPGEGVYLLQDLAAARAIVKTLDQMIGDWAMVRGGATICRLTLTNNDAGNSNFQVFLKPKCDPSIVAFAPTRWRLDDGRITLMSDRGETWRFQAAADSAQWRRVPDSGDPLIMVPQ
ncbi:MAG: AprI/Inh family metalloprotease inhibitor [Bradyrhizobium sp.]